jgi:SWI/SNF-related matrix-associated actin-dependent regulator 1 of chromatin subfamily A
MATATIIRTIRNKFSKLCATCSVKVETNEGFACQSQRGWETFCKKCVPVQIQQDRAEITSQGEVYFPYSPEAVALVKSLVGARFNKDGKFWTVDLSPANIARVLEVGEKLRLTIAEELKTKAVVVSSVLEEQIEQTIDTKGLFPFQVAGVKFLTSKKACLLGDEMGTGKTVQTLAALPKDMGIIVVCPASLKFNWRDEAKKWRPDLSPVVLSGRGSFRFPNAGEIVIVNYDILPQEFTTHPEFVLVCDEVHLTKNYKAKRSKAVKVLSGVAAKVIGLTGTPIMNRPFDLFGVLSALHLDREVFGSWMNFMRLFNGQKNRFGGYNFGAVSPIVPELLKRVMLRRRREEVLPELPRKSYTTLTVNGIPASLKARMDEMYDEVEGLLECEELPPFEMFSGLRAELAESRIDAMLEVVESHEEEGIPLVVFSAHRKPIDTLATREGWATITGSTKPEERQDIVRKFQSGALKGIGLTISAGGVGLTLTKAWKALFVDLDWTPALNSQAEDRICRIGQTKPCEIVRMVSDHILDQHILKLISQKIELFQHAIDNRIQATPIVGVESETEEQFLARMQKVQDELDAKTKEEFRTVALQKVDIIIAREKARITSGRLAGDLIIPEFTPELIQSIRNALDEMIGVCDGAVMKDGVGFNKPDAMLSRYLYAAGLDNPKVLEAAYRMLARYPKQVRFIKRKVN